MSLSIIKGFGVNQITWIIVEFSEDQNLVLGKMRAILLYGSCCDYHRGLGFGDRVREGVYPAEFPQNLSSSITISTLKIILSTKVVKESIKMEIVNFSAHLVAKKQNSLNLFSAKL